MGWYTRFTRFGDMHLVYGQEAGCSCGIASLMMCVFKVNKLKPGRDSLTVETEIYTKYEAVTGGHYAAETVGTYGDKLAQILTTMTPGTWDWKVYPPGSVAKALVDKVGVTTRLGPVVDVEPVILGVDWDSGGAHWVVVDTIRVGLGGAKCATICDPWDANVHMQDFAEGSPFRYDASTGGFSVNFWGVKPKGTLPGLTYDNGSKGQVKHWGMINRT